MRRESENKKNQNTELFPKVYGNETVPLKSFTYFDESDHIACTYLKTKATTT